MKKSIATVLIIVLSFCILTACGQGNGSAEEDNILRVGTNAEFPPFEYVGDSGEPEGFDIALIDAIAGKMGMETEVENLEFNSLVAAVGTKIDVAIAGMTIDEDRLQSVDFSDPYFEAVQYVIVPVGSEIAAAADLEGKNIGVQLGTTGDFIVQEDIGGATPVQFNKPIDAVNELLNGRVDCVIIDRNPAQVFVDQYPEELVALDGAQFGFAPESYAIALPKGDTGLAGQINEALAELMEDGTYDKLVKEYFE